MQEFILMRRGSEDQIVRDEINGGLVESAGKEAVIYVARQMTYANMIPEAIFYSTLPSARKTAETAKSVFNLYSEINIPMIAMESLTAGSKICAVDFLRAVSAATPAARRVLAVTHKDIINSIAGADIRPDPAQADVFELDAAGTPSRARKFRFFRG